MIKCLESIHITNHKILGDIDIDLTNPKTGRPYSIIAFVGENGCGKTTLLNELFKCDDIGNTKRNIAFLRQGQLYYSAMDHIKKLINGEGPSYPSESDSVVERINSMKGRHPDFDYHVMDLSIFDDETLSYVFLGNKNTRKFIPGGKVTALLDGKKGDDEYDKYSSGQQELIFKLQILSEASNCDLLLMDEPETSLHPRWQQKILNYVLSYYEPIEENGIVYNTQPQIFIASHSEKILESVLKQDNSLIVRLYRNEDKVIKCETITEMDLVLPKVTIAELDYVVFHIDTFDYHDELFNYFAYLLNKDSTLNVDKKILRTAKKIYNKDVSKFEKTRMFSVHGIPYVTNALPTYIRDYFHHPNEIIPPTSEELSISIGLMREIIKFKREQNGDHPEEISD